MFPPSTPLARSEFFWNSYAPTTDGTQIDQMALPNLAYRLIRHNWAILRHTVYGNSSFCLPDESFAECDKFRGPNLGRGQAAIVGGIEAGMGNLEMGHRFLCDLTHAPAEWLPVMTSRLVNVYTNDVLETPGQFSNTDDGRSPLTCGLSDQIIETPVGDLCPGAINGDEFRCNSVSDCTGSRFFGYGCGKPNPNLPGCCFRHDEVR